MRCGFSSARRHPTLWTSCVLVVDLALVFPIMLFATTRLGVRRNLSIVPWGRWADTRLATRALSHGEIVRQPMRAFFRRRIGFVGRRVRRSVGVSDVSLIVLRVRLGTFYYRETGPSGLRRFFANNSGAIFHDIVSQRLALRRPLNSRFGRNARALPRRLANLAPGGHLGRLRARRIADAPLVHVARLVHAPSRLVVLVVPFRHSPFLLRLSEQPKGTIPFG